MNKFHFNLIHKNISYYNIEKGKLNLRTPSRFDRYTDQKQIRSKSDVMVYGYLQIIPDGIYQVNYFEATSLGL